MMDDWQRWENEELVHVAELFALSPALPGPADELKQMITKAAEIGPSWTAEFVYLAFCRTGEHQKVIDALAGQRAGDPLIYQLTQAIALHHANKGKESQLVVEEINADWDDSESPRVNGNLKREVLRQEVVRLIISENSR